ncbi:MAG TPA: SIMPL domain-containing protein [Pyrinomonadaceae bacterium]|jgi:uncharacterized protein YggE
MKKVFLILLITAFCSLGALGQESGNRNYNRNTSSQRTPPNTGNLYDSNGHYIEAYVLLNSAPDEFVAVFGVAQEGSTAVESNEKVNALIDRFLSSAERLGINRGNTFVDFITQNRVYNFSPPADNVIRETLSGFETKKTVAVRYRDRAVLEKLVTAAAQASIFDLIKVDYIINDMTKIRTRLFEEAVRVIKQKEETYTRMLGFTMKRFAISQELYNTFYPAELYQSYTAYESGAVDSDYSSSGRRVIRERKSSTSYLEPLDRSAFDAVLTPIGIEPVVQSTLYLKMIYSLAR